MENRAIVAIACHHRNQDGQYNILMSLKDCGRPILLKNRLSAIQNTKKNSVRKKRKTGASVSSKSAQNSDQK
ncbi:MAG: hypothetical protein V3S64_16425, partial [bacterium]